MNSNYKTNDGKDLDERYLGISAKAASAKTADSIAFSSVSGRPTTLQFGGTYNYNSGNQNGMSITWSAPNNLIGRVSGSSYPGHSSDSTKLIFVVNGNTVASKTGEGTTTAEADYTFLKKGTQVKVTGTKGGTIPGRAYVQLTFTGSICSLA